MFRFQSTVNVHGLSVRLTYTRINGLALIFSPGSRYKRHGVGLILRTVYVPNITASISVLVCDRLICFVSQCTVAQSIRFAQVQSRFMIYRSERTVAFGSQFMRHSAYLDFTLRLCFITLSSYLVKNNLYTAASVSKSVHTQYIGFKFAFVHCELWSI